MRVDRLVIALALFATAAACSDDDDHRSNADVALGAAVRVEAEGCRSRPSVGGGSFVEDGRVLTVAHVVAGSTEVDVVLPDGSEHEAIVVAIDRQKDLAVLSVRADTTPLQRDSMRSGTKGHFVVWRDGVPVATPFRAKAFVDINAADIDHGETGLRRGYEILAPVEPGDSGSVLVADGKAVAIVFARSTQHPGTAWATDISEATELLAGAGDTAVDVGACT